MATEKIKYHSVITFMVFDKEHYCYLDTDGMPTTAELQEKVRLRWTTAYITKSRTIPYLPSEEIVQEHKFQASEENYHPNKQSISDFKDKHGLE